MNQIRVSRFKEVLDCTLSKITLLDKDEVLLFECFGMEPLKEGKTPNENLRIPEGKYGLLWHNSKQFGKKLPLLHNIDVPSSRYILIHSGNYPKDSIGCILVGDNINYYGDNKAMIEHSRATLEKLLSLLIKHSSGDNLGEWIVVVKNEFQ